MEKPKYTVYLKKQGFDLIDNDDKILSLIFSEKALEEGKIESKDIFEEEIKNFVGENKLKKEEAIIILAEDIVLEKIVNTEDRGADADKEEENFFKNVPISKADLIQKTIAVEKENILLAIDKSYYTAVKKAFEEEDIKIINILPQNPFFHPEKNKTVDPALLSVIYNNDELIKKVDLLSFSVVTEERDENEKEEEKEEDKKEVEEKEETKEDKKSGSLVLGIFLIVLIIALTIGVGSYLFINKPWVKESPTPTATMEPTAEETATPAATLAKKDINIEILNKTKTAGLAGKVEDKLTGFGEIKTGNTTSTDSATTEVIFSASISAEIKAEIETILNKMFSKVTTPEGVLPQGFHILIKTGAESL